MYLCVIYITVLEYYAINVHPIYNCHRKILAIISKVYVLRVFIKPVFELRRSAVYWRN